MGARREEFGIFTDEDQGPVCRGFCGGVAQATRRARGITDATGLESFVFSLQTRTIVARAFPKSIIRNRMECPSQARLSPATLTPAGPDAGSFRQALFDTHRVC